MYVGSGVEIGATGEGGQRRDGAERTTVSSAFADTRRGWLLRVGTAVLCPRPGGDTELRGDVRRLEVSVFPVVMASLGSEYFKIKGKMFSSKEEKTGSHVLGVLTPTS